MRRRLASPRKCAEHLHRLIGLCCEKPHRLTTSTGQKVPRAYKSTWKGSSRSSTKERHALNEETQVINVECRWETLKLRDQLLGVEEGGPLSPAAAAALTSFVEANKAVIEIAGTEWDLMLHRQPR